MLRDVVPTLTDMPKKPKRHLAPGVPVSMRLPDHLHRYVLVRAIIDDVPASEAIRAALEAALDREPPIASDDPEQAPMPLREALPHFDVDELVRRAGNERA
jgi:hypothetical protein